jgi:hypothetical protein
MTAIRELRRFSYRARGCSTIIFRVRHPEVTHFYATPAANAGARRDLMRCPSFKH